VVLMSVLLLFTDLTIFAVVAADAFFALVVTILNARALHKHLAYQQEKRKTFILPMVSALIMGGASYLTYRLAFPVIRKVTDSEWMANAIPSIIAIVVAVIIYFLLLLLLKVVDAEDIEK